MIRVLFFGPVADVVQAREISVAFSDGMKLQDIITQLGARYPRAFEIISLIAINQTQVNDRQIALSDNDEIAFMAKFSGG
ncbi:MAG: MoaD/ThiS family protein [Nitrosomonadales bacterium]|nr:MoaD/ThiS family protein [Nitrosomonadales bacterium]